MRRFLRALFARALSVFFRRIEVQGAERVPRTGPVLFVVNHPNGLVDPLLLLCFTPRPVAFLAKEPLFRMPLVGFFVRRFDSIPVHRRQDPGADLAKNRTAFESARRLLARGGSLALFPEGASHDAPGLLPMKTGVARIALGTAAQAGAPLTIIPAGLYYTWKQRFHSSALILFGEPIPVFPVNLDEKGDPGREDVRNLTERIGVALGELTLQAQSHEALDLVRQAERIFGEADDLAGELSRRRRFVEGYRLLAAREPQRLAKLEERIARFEAERRAAGLSLDHLTPEALRWREMARLFGRSLAALFLLPLAGAGVLIHYPAYRVAGFLARRIARRQPDVGATVKVAAGMLLFPATWLLGALAAWKLWGAAAGVATLVLLPISGWAALSAGEALDSLLGRTKALASLLFRGAALRRLLARRAAIRREIVQIAERLEAPSPGA